jgi:hypothetical protein
MEVILRIQDQLNFFDSNPRVLLRLLSHHTNLHFRNVKECEMGLHGQHKMQVQSHRDKEHQ